MDALNRGFEYRKQLTSDAAGLRVIDYLERHYSTFTREEWQARISLGRVLVDGIPAQQDQVLKSGQSLTWIRPPWKEPEVCRSFAILFRDSYLLAVAKPSGLPTVPGGGIYMENTLLSLVRQHFPKANPLHRLGRGTSGIVLFAMTKEAASKILQEWNNGDVVKVYLALATGCPKEDEFDINTAIGPVPHPILKTINAACPNGKPAHSRVKVIERRGDSSLLEVQITTGRPHQIRIHLAAAGYPLVGDPIYTIGGVLAEDSQALPSDLGYHLHHNMLGFHHPLDRKWIEIICVPPPLLRPNCGETDGN